MAQFRTVRLSASVWKPNNFVWILDIFSCPKTERSQAQMQLNRSDFRQLGPKTEHNVCFLDIMVQFGPELNVPFTDRFLIYFKAWAFEIRTCRKPNQQKFWFQHFPDFVRSDFCILLYFHSDDVTKLKNCVTSFVIVPNLKFC